MELKKHTNWFEKILGLEDRLLYKYKTGPERLAPGVEVTRKHEDVIKAIDANIGKDRKSRERYSRFEKGKKDRALLLSILKKRAKEHPENISGLTKDNKNLDLIALRHTEDADVLRGAETAQKKLLKDRKRYATKANEIYKTHLKG